MAAVIRQRVSLITHYNPRLIKYSPALSEGPALSRPYHLYIREIDIHTASDMLHTALREKILVSNKIKAEDQS